MGGVVRAAVMWISLMCLPMVGWRVAAAESTFTPWPAARSLALYVAECARAMRPRSSTAFLVVITILL